MLTAAIAKPLIRRIDRHIEKYHNEAIAACPDSPLQQDRWLRDKLVEDCAPAEAAVVAMKCDHYLFCLRVNSQIPMFPC
jgi:hypothetical protein